MRKIFFGVLFVVAFQFVAAQVADVVSIRQLSANLGNVYFPTVSPSGDYVLVSGAGYNGLVKIDLETNKKTVLSTAPFAGYYPSISADGKKIAYREDSYQDNRRYVSLKTIDLSSSNTKPVEVMSPSRDYSGMRISKETLKIAKEKKEIRKSVESTAQGSDSPLLTIEDGLMTLYTNGIRTVLAPNGKDKSYIWASISPDGKKIVYTTPPHKTWICDIDGQNPVALGHVGAPQWLGNNHIIGMTDEDDGNSITSSSIITVSVDGKTRQTLTSSSMIALFPTVSADGRIVAFHTPEGKIYIMNIHLK